jgi:hypothetical protein
VVPADKVESVSVGAYQGEYVKGDFNNFSSKPDNNTWVWSYDDHRQRLAWSEDNHWYLIDFIPNLNIANTMTKDDLIRLAQSLVTSPCYNHRTFESCASNFRFGCGGNFRA